MNNLTQIEKQILQIIQANFPLTPRPFEVIGQTLGISEQVVIDILQSLKNRHILREICGIFNASSLGFTSVLIGFYLNENCCSDY